jgi:ribonucleoside-diphosphate reductase alpha chain
MAELQTNKTTAAPSSATVAKPKAPGLNFRRFYTKASVSPYNEVAWEKRTATITDSKGEVIFEQQDVEVPKDWSMTATNIVASKYLHGQLGTPERETGVRQLVARVAESIRDWGVAQGYFRNSEDAATFHDELVYLLIRQHAAFNSPVWFNVGCDRIEPNSDSQNWHWNAVTNRVEFGLTGYSKPQCSACFINSVQDSLDSILTLAKTEGMLFKWGSGTGTNLSPLRSSSETLSGGGTASGPLSFMKGFDAFAGVIKSGGKTRRAAKMVILNADHPDIVDFIECKSKEEAKAHALTAMGYDGSSPDSEAYSSIFFQNANNSVRVTDDFMYAVLRDTDFCTRAVKDNRPVETFKAKELLHKIADATWRCGDPGMQFDSTINRWHTSKNTARINASNPCVTGETLVATSEGWRRIDSLTGKSALIFGSDGQPHLVQEIFPTGTKPVFHLRTRSGFELRLTAEHKVLTTNRGDVRAGDLQPGDRVVLQGAGFGRRALGARLALALGVAVGDGCLTRSEHSGRPQEIITLVMAGSEAGVLEKIAAEVNAQKTALRAVAAVGRAGGVSVASHKSTSRLAFSSQSVVELFKQFTVLDEGSEHKQFTPEIFELDKPSLAGVLCGLFTADATVANYDGKSQYVSLDSSSEILLRQVQILLLSFGIKAKLYSERRGTTVDSLVPDGRDGSKLYAVKQMYSLRVSRSSRFIFEREIGFDPESPKAEQLAEMNREIGAYCDSLTDAVESFEAEGEEPVFDLTEPMTSHFSANGLMVHNCSEYMFLDDSACNLASLNLLKFAPNGTFDVEAYRHAVDILITAQEIIVDNAGYPTEMIARNSHDYRPLGLGYANLGALLMACGLPYDSEAGRDYAACVTAIMSGEAYLQSSRIAELCSPLAPATEATQRGLGETNLGQGERVAKNEGGSSAATETVARRGGACPGFYINREPFLDVIRMHRASVNNINRNSVPGALYEASKACWDEALANGEKHGYRNSQVTVLAPTGTIGFFMDCDTTGIEPDLALVKFKKLVGGGMIKIVNNTVPAALFKLGYTHEQADAIVSYIDATGTIEGAPNIKDEHLPVFDCSFKPAKGTRSIPYMGHLRMMAAAQPFISGAISKTVNLPEAATTEEIMEAYIQAWKLGLKAVAIYRDGCKKSQPLSAAGTKTAEAGSGARTPVSPPSAEEQDQHAPPRAVRHKLDDERMSITHKFNVGGHEGYITVGLYRDGSPGEIFITMAKEGSTVSGLMDSFACAISLALQHGVPLKLLCEKFAHTRFEPSGWTNNPDIGFAKSIMDYIFRWLQLRFLTGQQQLLFENLRPRLPGQLPEMGDVNGSTTTAPVKPEGRNLATGPIHAADALAEMVDLGDAPSCHVCGSIMVRNGSCYKCMSCGSTSGCS